MDSRSWLPLGLLMTALLSGCVHASVPALPARDWPGDAASQAGSPDQDGAWASAARGEGKGKGWFETLRACLPVQVDAAAGPIHANLIGTLYLPRKADAGTRLVVLVPGGLTQRHAFDGGSQGPAAVANATLPRLLAREGWAALTIDRLGVGESVVTVHGSQVTTAANVDALVQAVERLRSGSYAVGPSCADDPISPFPSIVLAGESYGGFLVLAAASRVHIDGAVLLSSGLWGASGPSAAYQAECAARAGGMDAQGYFVGFCDDGLQGLACVDWISWPASRDQGRAQAFCDDLRATREPAGIVSDFPTAGQLQEWALSFPPVPVYANYAGRDRIIAHGDPGGSPTMQEQADRFDAMCGCDGTASLHGELGHVHSVSTSATRVDRQILSWLEATGLGPSA